MKRILAYGDSNTWGFDPVTWGSVPMTLERYPEDIRWTGLLQKALGKDALVLEEGLCGRTTAFDEHSNRSHFQPERLCSSLFTFFLRIITGCSSAAPLRFLRWGRWCLVRHGRHGRGWIFSTGQSFPAQLRQLPWPVALFP